jgi:peptidoglycan/LPS O-acetylase OafA/YrhL
MTSTSTTQGRLRGLDTLRALAIVWVMLFHLGWRLPAILGPIGRFGWMGVDLFFVLSGYLIGSQLLKPVRDGRRLSLAQFYRRRAYRILPVFLVVLALYALWPAWREAPGLSPLWQFLTFTENFFVDYTNNQAFSHVWSLCVEEHFYLLLPLLVLVISSKPAAWKTVLVLTFFAALGMAIRSYELFHVLRHVDHDHFGTRYIEAIYYPTYTRLDGLLAGVALALIQIFRPAWWSECNKRANRIFLAGIALLAIALWVFTDRFGAIGTVIGFPLLALSFAMLVAAAASRRSWLARLHIPGAQTVAMLAYSLYLTHKEAAHLDEVYLPRIMASPDWRAAALIAVSCLAVSALFYFAIERPCLVLRDRREGRRSAHVDVEANVEPAL